MTASEAERIALLALGWLASSDEIFPLFLGATGAAPADLRSGADDPDFLAAIVDFVIQNDDWIIACCDSADLPRDSLMRARAALPGGQLPHWT